MDYAADIFKVLFVVAVLDQSDLDVFSAFFPQNSDMLVPDEVDVAHNAVVELLELPYLPTVVVLYVDELMAVFPEALIDLPEAVHEPANFRGSWMPIVLSIASAADATAHPTRKGFLLGAYPFDLESLTGELCRTPLTVHQGLP